MPKNYSYFNCPNVRDPIHRWKICEHLNAASWGPNDGFTDSSLGFLIGFPLKSVGVYLNITDAPTLHSMRKLSSKHTFEYIGCTRSGAEELNIVIARIIEWECIFFLRTNVVSNEGFLNSDFRVFFFESCVGIDRFVDVELDFLLMKAKNLKIERKNMQMGYT